MNKKLKSILLTALAAVMLLSLAACGSDTPSNTPDAGTPTSTPSDAASNPTPSSTPDTNINDAEPKGEEFSVELLSLQSELSQGVAWIEYREVDGPNGRGIVNTEGQVIPITAIPENTVSIMYSDFVGGFSFATYYDKEKDGESFIIIDTQGNVTAKSADDAGYAILCGGDDWYFVRKNIQTMTASERHYGLIDAHGNWLVEPTRDFLSIGLAENETYGVGLTDYLGNGIFWISGSPSSALYDAKNMANPIIPSPISTDNYVSTNKGALGLYNESIIVWDGNSNGTTIYSVEPDGTSREIVTNTFASMSPVKYGEGIVFVGNCFYDMNGNVIADYSEHRFYDELDFNGFATYAFEGGYAAVLIVGADRDLYLEIIDTTGACAFEPIKLSFSNHYFQDTNGRVACHVDKTAVWVDVKGNITERPDGIFIGGYAVVDNQIINVDGEALELHLAQ